MEITTGLVTAESELARFTRHKFDFRNPIPISLNFAVLIFPNIFKKGYEIDMSYRNANHNLQRARILRESFSTPIKGLDNYTELCDDIN